MDKFTSQKEEKLLNKNVMAFILWKIASWILVSDDRALSQ